MPPGTSQGSLFEAILTPSWHQGGPKGGFLRVRKPGEKKHEKRKTQGTSGMTPAVPLKEQNNRPADLTGIRDTPLVPCGHGGGYTIF